MIRTFFTVIYQSIKKLFFAYKMKCLKYKCDKLTRENKEAHYIFSYKGKITLMSKSIFKYNRQHGVFPKSFTAKEMRKISYYHT